MNFPVFDLHCDTALSLLGKSLRETGSLLHNDGHLDLERAQALPGFAQCFACFTTPFMQDWYHETPETVFEREMVSVLREIEKNKDRIRLAYTAKDVKDNFDNGLMSGILTIEGPAGFGFDPELLEDLHKVGFRMTTLGWNEDNVLTGSHMTGGGLTQQGKDYVFEAQRLGMIVDVSHISDTAFWDIINITQAPIVASHSNSRAVCNVSRNLTDDMFKAICSTGGVAGFNQCAPFVGENPDLDTACDHILHFLELDPDGRHIALGGDLDGCDTLPDGFAGVQDYPKLAGRLLERGVDETLVRRIFWENALGVMEVCCM
ncbi:MAG: membrane dipeptidase [Oscillospiraceae bacterium]|nr:membrane dipeptidase [Oscillospiraceae bacterium]